MDVLNPSLPVGVGAQPAPTDPPSAPPAKEELAAASSQLAAFTAYLESLTNRRFADHAELDAFCALEFRTFWSAFLQWCRPALAMSASADPVCVGDDCEHARFFPLLQLSYADSLLNLQVAGADTPGITECHADGSARTWTRGELRTRVERLAQQLSRLGLREGDRVVAVMRNDAHAAIAALAVTALGATISTASTDMGLQALLDRFEPLQPRLLVAHLAEQPHEAGLSDRLHALMRSLPALQAVLALDEGELPAGCGPALLHRFEDCRAPLPQDGAFGWPRFHFNHPLFLMFSSGTTGKPKCIEHGAGGSLLEHLKEHRLHTDLKPGDRLYFHTSCGWMMWNWQLSALASGVEVITYDGPVDSVQRLWELVARRRVTVFGTSPGYLKMCEEAGYEPSQLDLAGLRAVLSTGAVLHDSQFAWIAAHARNVPVQSISGGTDIVGCFVLGHPHLPVRPGQAQCRSLGLDVQAWADGAPTRGVGQLVCANPFPSRPLGLHGDEDGSRFHATYFAQNPGVWTHGDLVEFSEAGGARLHGRCDGMLNVRGTKFHPGEVYRVLAGERGILDAMLVPRGAAGEQQVVGLFVLAAGTTLTADFAARVRRTIREALSAAHVPDLLLDVAQLPVTHNGKPSEAAARAAVNGQPCDNLAALRNPQCLEAIRCHPRLQAGGDVAMDCASLLDRMCAVWTKHLSAPQVLPHDNFFELGGNSLTAARVLRDVQALTGCVLPLSALLQAPTPAGLVELAQARRPPPLATLVRMREGAGTPLFLVHGLSGTAMDCWALVNALATSRPVWGFQARGLDGLERPLEQVEAIAADYLAELRAVQPRGPYALCGFSFGGLVAYEVACRLASEGEAVESLVLLDPYVRRDLSPLRAAAERGRNVLRRLARMPAREAGRSLVASMRAWRRNGFAALRRVARPTPGAGLGMPPEQQSVYDTHAQALLRYRPPPYAGPVLFVHATELVPGYLDPMPTWRRVAAHGLRVVDVPGEHLDLIRANARRVAALLDEALR